jgi:endonuclease YncB( thermonuclease family)
LEARPPQVAVVDGATLKLQNRVVRLLGVDPPPRGASCRANDGSEFDCGTAATNALADLVSERPVACRAQGQDALGRPYALCQAGGTDLNRAQVAAGWARAEATLPALKLDEAKARTERRGLWAGR